MKLLHNPSKQTHIDGIDCDNHDRIGVSDVTTVNANVSSLTGAMNDVVNVQKSNNDFLLIEMRILKYLLMLL